MSAQESNLRPDASSSNALRCPICEDLYRPYVEAGGEVIPLWCPSCRSEDATARVSAHPLKKALRSRMVTQDLARHELAATLGIADRTMARILHPSRIYIQIAAAEEWASRLRKHPTEIWGPAWWQIHSVETVDAEGPES